MADLSGDRAEDAQLVPAAQRGDVRAQERLFGKYQRKIYGLIYRMLGDSTAASDLTQDTFVRAFSAMKNLKGGQNFLPWLWQVATNITRDELRRRGRRKEVSSSESLSDDEGNTLSWEFEDTGPLPDKSVEDKQRDARLMAALQQIPPERREVIILHHLQGADVKEISEALGIPVGTVKSRLARGREDLKKLLQDLLE